MLKILVPIAASLPFLLLILLVGALGGPGRASAEQYGASVPSKEALADIPKNYLEYYQAAGAREGIDWAYLAGIGKIESDHGRSKAKGVAPPLTNFHGCCAGPMQFCVIDGCPEVGPKRLTVAQAQAGTWRGMGVDGNGDGVKNPWDPEDAIGAAAKYLKASGAPADWKGALFAYNPSETYGANVIAQADRYREAFVAAAGGPGAKVADPAMRKAVANSPNITWGDEPDDHRASITSGKVDGRIVAVLDWITKSHKIMIFSMEADRVGDSTSNHSAGRAVDIAMVDGVVCRGRRDDACGRLAVELAKIPGPLHSSELIYFFDPDGPDNLGDADDAWAAADHNDHIHFGYDK